eukprot:1159945-Pelagomonas_calceolata.AAC.10
MGRIEAKLPSFCSGAIRSLCKILFKFMVTMITMGFDLQPASQVAQSFGRAHQNHGTCEDGCATVTIGPSLSSHQECSLLPPPLEGGGEGTRVWLIGIVKDQGNSMRTIYALEVAGAALKAPHGFGNHENHQSLMCTDALGHPNLQVLLGKPLMVFGPSPTDCSWTVAALLSLIAPIPFAYDFR